MPQPKKGGASRSSAKPKAPSAPKAGTTNRKKPGPKPGTKRRNSRAGKAFNLYTIVEGGLAFVTEAKGATGKIATANAVKLGSAEAGVPYLPLPVGTLKRTVEIEKVEREPTYKIKTGASRRKPGPKPGTKRSAPKEQASTPAETPTPPAPAAPKAASGRGRSGGRRPAPPKPPASTAGTGNPFTQ